MASDIYSQALYDRWRAYWKEHRTFAFDENDTKRPYYVIDTPPPFTTGDLHIGQVFWVCYIDALARYKRMRGYNVMYPQGWDTHGFPTELAVEKKYGNKLSREEFYDKCMELSAANIKAMKDKMVQLGSTFDERYEYITISKDYMTKVQYSMLLMNEKGMVYIGSHPVEWCVKCGSGIAREETEEKEEESNLYHVDFRIAGDEKGAITIATSRPELMHACVAIAVNPNDKRYKKLVGKSAEVPLFGTRAEIIADDAVDKEYGTGAEMVCTFGDKRDILLYYKHELPLIESMDREGRLLNAGDFTGEHVSKAREKVVERLTKDRLIKKRERIKHVIKVHDRDSCPVEFLSSKQWFIKTKENAERIKRTASEMRWVPEPARQRLDDWANFIEWDWNVSRNRVFGTPIPFWHCQSCDRIVAPKREDLPIDTTRVKPPVGKCPKCGGKVVGTEDTLDVWVDSSITPLVISGWPDNKRLFEKAFPATVRIQGTDIVRTWAFYTIFRTPALAGDKPFESIIVHNMILDQEGKEMHKSLGTGMGLDQLVPKYPIDAVRLWVALSGAIGKDKAFSYADMDYAKSFLTKLYNTAKFVETAIGKGRLPKEEPHKQLNVFDVWILNRLNAVVGEVAAEYDNSNLNAAMTRAANFYWHEFADFYIENVKHRVYSKDKGAEGSRAAALFTLKYVLDASLRMFAPVIPFTCEEINSMFGKGSVFDRAFPEYKERASPASYIINGVVFASDVVDADPESIGAFLNNVISGVRKEKARARLALNKEISSININVPEEYYSAVVSSAEELKQILKAREISAKKAKEFSVSIKQ